MLHNLNIKIAVFSFLGDIVFCHKIILEFDKMQIPANDFMVYRDLI